MDYRCKRPVNYGKLIWRYCKHIGYRIRHYAALAWNAPFLWKDYIVGYFCYQSAPMRRDMDYKRFSKEHGRYGEFQLWRKARKRLPRDTVWFSNLYLPKNDGTTCEIDLVAVCQKGVFVFESKNYNGWIYGNEKNPNWYQMVRNDVNRVPKKYPFFNPVMQNGMHCRTLALLMSLPRDTVHSFVVFSDRCRLKDLQLESDSARVCSQRKLGGHLRKYKESILDAETVLRVCSALANYTNVSYHEKSQHIASVQNGRNG